MSEQEPAPFNFWWATSKAGSKVMGWAFAAIAVGQFINGCNAERLPRHNWNGEIFFEILVGYVAIGVVAWYFLINIGRFVYFCINRTEAVQTMQETRRENVELETLRRRKELRDLRQELGDETVADGGVRDSREESSQED